MVGVDESCLLTELDDHLVYLKLLVRGNWRTTPREPYSNIMTLGSVGHELYSYFTC